MIQHPPKITGLLNNCILNCALPTLIRKIGVLAEIEKNKVLPLVSYDAIYNNYEKLKNLFAGYYGIRNANLLTWQQFNGFIITHSFYANEIIFAPILRNFIAEFGAENGCANEGLWRLKDIQFSDSNLDLEGDCSGQYSPLDAHEAMRLFHYKFGIHTELFDHVGDDVYVLTHTFNPSPIFPSAIMGDAPMLRLYFKNMHYEVQSGCNLAKATKAFTNEINWLPHSLHVVHEQLTASTSAFETDRALGNLVLYVKNSLQANLDAALRHEFIVSAPDYAEIGQKIHNDTSAGRLTFAVILLTLCSDSLKEVADSFLLLIQELSKNPADANQLDKLLTEIIEDKGHLTSAALKMRVLSKTTPAIIDSNLSTMNSFFELKCLVGLAAVGAVLLCATIVLTCAPVALISTATSLIMGASGSALLLLSAGLFARRSSGEVICPIENVNESQTNSSNCN